MKSREDGKNEDGSDQERKSQENCENFVCLLSVQNILFSPIVIR